MEVPPEHRAFADLVQASRLQDPMPTFRVISEATGIPVADLVHHALVRWTAAGSEMLMSIDSLTLNDLVAARRREDWQAVAGIIDWLTSGS